MKKAILFAVLLKSLNILCQNWVPINQSDSIIHFLAEDSIKINSFRMDKYFHPIQSVVLDSSFNNINIYKKGYSSINIGTGNFSREPIKGQILGDTIKFYSDSVIVNSIDQNGFKWIFPTKYTAVGRQWKLGISIDKYVIATLDSLFELNISGYGLDSVAELTLSVLDTGGNMLLQHPFYNSKIRLTKSTGLYSSPNLTNLQRSVSFKKYNLNNDTLVNFEKQRLKEGDEYILVDSSYDWGGSYISKSTSFFSFQTMKDSLINNKNQLTFNVNYHFFNTFSTYSNPNGFKNDRAERNLFSTLPVENYSPYSGIIDPQVFNFGVCNQLGDDFIVRYRRGNIAVGNNYITYSYIPKYKNYIDLIGIGAEEYIRDGSHRTNYTKYSSIIYINKSDREIGLKPNIKCAPTDTLIIEENGYLKATIDRSEYQWIDCDSNNIAIVDSIDQLYYPSASGRYAVLINDRLCIDTSDCLLFQTPKCSLGDSLIAIDSIGFIALIDSASYNWLDCNNSFSEVFNETSQRFTPSLTGSYSVEITKEGCTDTSTCLSNVGIQKTYLLENIFISPNPVKNVLIIRSNFEILSIELFDSFGHIIDIYFEERRIDMSKYSTGIYYLRIYTHEGSIVKKIIRSSNY